MFGGSSRNRLRGNRLSGNGYAAQGNNFGIGILSASHDNVVEGNTVTGNTNGVSLAATVQGNIIRRNLIVGNPPVQVDLDHPSAKGLDIKNLSPSGANTFQGNKCLTAVNAPCPAVKHPEEKDK
jgi:parallel beta-helix repeat protein